MSHVCLSSGILEQHLRCQVPRLVPWQPFALGSSEQGLSPRSHRLGPVAVEQEQIHELFHPWPQRSLDGTLHLGWMSQMQEEDRVSLGGGKSPPDAPGKE